MSSEPCPGRRQPRLDPDRSPCRPGPQFPYLPLEAVNRLTEAWGEVGGSECRPRAWPPRGSVPQFRGWSQRAQAALRCRHPSDPASSTRLKPDSGCPALCLRVPGGDGMGH